MQIGDETNAAIEVVEDVHIYFYSFKNIVLNDILYVPNFKRNLILVSYLFNEGLTATFNNSIVIFRIRLLICKG